MKQRDFKTSEMARREFCRLEKAGALFLICFVLVSLNAMLVAQAKPSGQPVKPAGVIAPTPTPTPTPTPKPTSQTAGPAQPKAPAAALPAAPAASGDVNQMTTQQFRALPPTAQVIYNGQTMTKAAFIDQRRKELRAQAKSLQTKAEVKFKGAKADFQQQQTLDLAARNAKVKAVADGYDRRLKQLAASPAYSALSKEASTIVQRYPSASPAEQAKLKQRAAELHSQLQKMEQEAIAGH